MPARRSLPWTGDAPAPRGGSYRTAAACHGGAGDSSCWTTSAAGTVGRTPHRSRGSLSRMCLQYEGQCTTGLAPWELGPAGCQPQPSLRRALPAAGPVVCVARWEAPLPRAAVGIELADPTYLLCPLPTRAVGFPPCDH